MTIALPKAKFFGFVDQGGIFSHAQYFFGPFPEAFEHTGSESLYCDLVYSGQFSPSGAWVDPATIPDALRFAGNDRLLFPEPHGVS